MADPDRPAGRASHGAAVLCHLVAADAWSLAATGDRYAPDSLATEGFVHLSAPHQLADVAAARFAGRDDLLLLVVDPDRLDVPLVWEDTAGEGQDFPHAYGALPLVAVVAVHRYRPDHDGRFPHPGEIAPEVPRADVTGSTVEVPGAGGGDRTVRFVDLSSARRPLGTGVLADAPSPCTVADLLERRVRAEVAAYSRDPGPVYVGLVQPHDAVRLSAGCRVRTPRPLDPEPFVTALREALAAGHVHVEVAGARSLGDATLELPDGAEVTVVLQRPLAAQDRPWT